MKVMLELRPAFEGHSGIPQETRLLFRHLADLEGVEPVGLLQSGGSVAEPGLPVRAGLSVPDLPEAERADRLSKVVVSLQQAPPSHKLESLRRRLLGWFGPLSGVLRSAFGGSVRMGSFDPTQYKDFLWRSLFAKSLRDEDASVVTTSQFRVLRWPWSKLHAIGVVSSWLGRGQYARLDTTGIDIFISETPLPARVASATKLVVRYHDAIPLLMPHTIKDRDYHRSAHFQALRRNIADGAWFACVSESTRRDLLVVAPSLASRAVTIPNMLAQSFFAETRSGQRVPEIVWSRKNRQGPEGGGAPIPMNELKDGLLSYLLVVGTLEPRKNHLSLIDTWERLRSDGFGRLHLLIVGALGWEHQTIVQRLAPWLRRGGAHLLTGVPSDDLRLLYRHAAVTVCPSFGEGFDFPGIEAMRSGGVVAASDLPVHRDVFADGCEYFNPYSVKDMAQVIGGLLTDGAAFRRTALVQAGARVAERYLPERILPMWQRFLREVAAA